MDYFSILAQAAHEAEEVVLVDKQIVPIDFIWEQIVSLSWLQAVLAISFGIVYLMYGWRIFRVLVIICFALIGLFVGLKIGNYFGVAVTTRIWCAVIGLGLLAAVSVPLMRWCVCILGAVAGALITGGIWYACELPQMYIWAGATVGAVAGGMISFIVLKASVMLFTSMGGSIITVVGLLALLHLYENASEPFTTYIKDTVYNQDWFLPTALIVPTVIGLIIQNKFIKHSHKWEL